MRGDWGWCFEMKGGCLIELLVSGCITQEGARNTTAKDKETVTTDLDIGGVEVVHDGIVVVVANTVELGDHDDSCSTTTETEHEHAAGWAIRACAHS